METAVAMAHAMGRTLVMPPEQKMYLLGKKDKHSKNTLSFEDFYHFDSVAVEHAGVEVISTEEFLEREIMSGNIRHPQTGGIMHPPQNKTDWHGIGTYHSQTFKELASFLREAGISSTWDYSECIVAFPKRTGPGTSNELEGLLQDILNDGDRQARMRSYDGNPTPVDASPRDRMREMLAGRDHLCVYNETLQQAPVFHFPGGGKYRLLIHFYAFMFFEDYRQDLWTKRFVRDHLRYVDEIQCAAARVVAAVREKARHHGNPHGLFDSFHIRRGDLQYKDCFIEADEILDNVGNLLLEKNSTIFIATDERNMTYFDPLREHYHLYFLHDFMDEVGSINKNFYGMLDQRIASRGRTFFGVSWPHFNFVPFVGAIDCIHISRIPTLLLPSIFLINRRTIPHSPALSLECVATTLSWSRQNMCAQATHPRTTSLPNNSSTPCITTKGCTVLFGLESFQYLGETLTDQ